MRASSTCAEEDGQELELIVSEANITEEDVMDLMWWNTQLHKVNLCHTLNFFIRYNI
jgi:hypothetical protein